MRHLLISICTFGMLSFSPALLQAQNAPSAINFNTVKGKTFQFQNAGSADVVVFSPSKQVITVKKPNTAEILEMMYRIHEDKVILGKTGMFFTFSTTRDTMYLQPDGLRVIRTN